MDETIDEKVEGAEKAGINTTKIVKEQNRCPYYIQCPSMRDTDSRCTGAYQMCNVYHELKKTYEDEDAANLMVGG